MSLSIGITTFDTPRRQGYSLSMDGHKEAILIARAKDGDATSFEQLVVAHTTKALNLAYRLVNNREEAEDIVQEAFFRLHKSLASFRGDSTVATWLYRTVSRLAIDHLRREKLRRNIFFFRRGEEDNDPIDMVADPGASPHDELQAVEASRRLMGAIKKLSVRQRAVFVLRHQEELPLKEIAAILELEEGTVKTHLHRAVQLLRKELKDLEKGSP